MKNSVIILNLLICLVLSQTSYAQISEGGEPLFSKNISKSISKSKKIPTVELPAIAVSKLIKEDLEDGSKNRPARFAYGHKVNLNPENSGVWFQNDKGEKFWLLKLRSRGAQSLNLTFSDFHLPKGSKLFLYNEDKTEVRGAFTSANNKASKRLGTSPILGDNITIEYYQPKTVTTKPALQISTVAHDYKGIYNIAKDFGDSGSCHNNVNCDGGKPWRKQIRSVAMSILADGTRWCSGALVNNTEKKGRPFYLTAEHCVEGEDVSNWVFVFRYQSQGCENQNASLSRSISGSRLLKKEAKNDFALLRLSSTPPESYKPFYSGWNARNTKAKRTVGIHHPSSDIKKISFSKNSPSADDGYWSVKWSSGSTEPGSSGSPLFDENKRIVGVLSGGDAACGNNEPDFYGRMDKIFGKIKQWLAPDSNKKILDGYDPLENKVLDDIATENKELSLKEAVVYPNPAKNAINIGYKIKKDTHLTAQIIDIRGKIIKELRFNGEADSFETLKIDDLNLPSGSYFLNISENSKGYSNTVVKRFVIAN